MIHKTTPSTSSCSSYASSSSLSPNSFTKFSERLDLGSHIDNSFDQFQLTNTMESVRIVDGKKFFNDEESKYPFPIDDKSELIRNRMTHYLTKSVWNGNFSAPRVDERLKKGAKVLDVCCGLGFWTLDMANTYPNSTFVGIDLAPMFPCEDARPPNAGFLECNILDGIPFPDETFDFVYQRFVWSAFNESQWQKIIHELVRVTKKGGVLELMEFNWGFKNPGPKTQLYEKEVSSYFYSQGINPYIAKRLPEYLGQVSQLTDIRGKEISCGLGGWDGQLGEMSLRHLFMCTSALEAVFIRFTNITEKEYRKKIKDLTKEFGSFKTYCSNVRIFARKI